MKKRQISNILFLFVCAWLGFTLSMAGIKLHDAMYWIITLPTVVLTVISSELNKSDD